jgi:chlorobactene glucosyltransferase
MTLLAWVCAGLALFALGLTLFNLAVWPRGRAQGRLTAPISVLIPARNEEENIEACVRALAASQHPLEEIVVCDDHSTDQTPAILARLQAELPQLRVIQGRPLAEGWVGKPHATHQLAQAARGEVLLFVDADTVFTPEGVGRVASLFEDLRADLVTAVPRQETGGFFERLILPLLYATYCNWLPLPLIWGSKDARFLAANGQVLALRRAAYQQVGGYEAVKHEIVDDMAIARLVKRAGLRVVFADGFEVARCRMYRSARQVWEGFSKNIYEGIGGSLLALLGIVGLFSATYLAPFALLASAWAVPGLLLPAAVGVGANLAMRAALAWRHRQPWESALLHPLGVVGLLLIAVNSLWWTRSGKLRWRGRVYAGRAQRAGGA